MGTEKNRECSISARAVNRFAQFSVCSVPFVSSALSLAGAQVHASRLIHGDRYRGGRGTSVCNRHRGSGRPLSPATPPDMRVRIRRFRGLRSVIVQGDLLDVRDRISP